jgi:hypothetical protein
MTILQLSPFARARVTMSPALLKLDFVGDVTRTVVACHESIPVSVSVAVECVVGRGGRLEYGMLGFEHIMSNREELLVSVGYTMGCEVAWPNSLAEAVDEVRLGLPKEFAEPILLSSSDFATGRFPPGQLRLITAAYGEAGSSPRFFRKLAVATLSLMNATVTSDETNTMELRDHLLY